MPYIRVDLDGKKRVPLIARALGTDSATIGWGLVELWEFCWMTHSDMVSGLQLRAFFGPTLDPADQLVEYGFLEQSEPGYRVRGVARWLGVRDAQREAGKAHARNLIAGPHRLSPGRSKNAPGIAGDPLRVSSGSPSGSPSGSLPGRLRLFHPDPQIPRSQTKEERVSTGVDARGPIQAIWDEFAAPTLARWRQRTKARQTTEAARWKEHPDPAYWRGVVDRINASPFCLGEKGWKADLDFMLTPAGASKVLEGKYDGGSKSADITRGAVRAETQKHDGDLNF